MPKVNRDISRKPEGVRGPDFIEGDRSAYLSDLLDTIPALVASLNPDWEVEFVNQPLFEFLGKRFEDIKDWKRSGVVHAEDLQIAAQNVDRANETGAPFSMEVRCRRNDGQYLWFQIRAVPRKSPDTQVTQWNVHMVDIEDRKRAEQALAASERNLRLAIDTMPVLAWSTDAAGAADFFNEHFLVYTGLPSEAARGWGWTVALHPEDREALGAYWSVIVAEGRTGEFEARIRRSDGFYRYFLFRANPLRDDSGNVVRWFGTNTDINDRKEAEEQLRRSEAFLAEAQRLTRIGRFQWRIATSEIMWSNEMYTMFEFDPSVTITFDRIASRLHPDDLRLVADMNQRAAEAMDDLEYEHRLVMPNGHIKYMHLIAHSRYASDGTLEYIGAVQDVTQRRKSEESLAKARQELATVNRATSLGVLTASIAHEVNQPLAGIVTNASTCLRMLDGPSPNIEGARETARRTIRDGNRAAAVVTKLRSLFSQKKIVLEAVNLSDIASEVISMSANELQERGVAIHEELDELLPSVQADRVQLQQVILNLLRNAADAMDEIATRPKLIQITTGSDSEGSVWLTVRDSGVGLNSELAETIFEAFNTTKPDGMGIGLSVSRAIITAHRGRIWATQNVGARGATFSFSLPTGLRESTGSHPKH